MDEHEPSKSKLLLLQQPLGVLLSSIADSLSLLSLLSLSAAAPPLKSSMIEEVSVPELPCKNLSVKFLLRYEKCSRWSRS